MIIFLRDLYSVIVAWLTVWWVNKPKAERRLRFMEDAFDEKRKRELLYRLIKKAYVKRLNHQP